MNVFDLLTRFASFAGQTNNVDVIQIAGITPDSGAATISTNNDIVFKLMNGQYTLPSASYTTGFNCDVQAVGTFCYYLIVVNQNNAVFFIKGTDNAYALPSAPIETKVFGAFKITADGVTTFTAGATNFDATGITAVFFDIDAGIALSLIQDCQRKLERGIVVSQSEDKGAVRISDFNHMKVHTQVALSVNQFLVANPFPTFKRLIHAIIIDTNGRAYKKLAPVDYSNALLLFPSLAGNLDRPILISRVPAAISSFSPATEPVQNFILRPSCNAIYTLDLMAYQYTPDLDSVIYQSNWWTENAPEVLLYGSLVDGAAYLEQNADLPKWEKMYVDAVAGLVEAEKSAKGESNETEYRFN